MSGGSLNYLYRQVEEAAAQVKSSAETPLHRAFAEHLSDVAEALHDLEWVWSNDYARGDEEAAIRKCIDPAAPLAINIDDAVAAAKALITALKQDGTTNA